VVAVAGCGSSSTTTSAAPSSASSSSSAGTPGGSSSAAIPPLWQGVANCLDQNHSFGGSATYDAGAVGPGRIGTLRIHDRSGAIIANASRYASHAYAVKGESGIGPPGPVVYFYGAIALEAPRGNAYKADRAAIKTCFDKAFSQKT
jgi:hypothetical protein